MRKSALKEIYSITTTITLVHGISSALLLLLIVQLIRQGEVLGVFFGLVAMFLNNKLCQFLHRKQIEG